MTQFDFGNKSYSADFASDSSSVPVTRADHTGTQGWSVSHNFSLSVVELLMADGMCISKVMERQQSLMSLKILEQIECESKLCLQILFEAAPLCFVAEAMRSY